MARETLNPEGGKLKPSQGPISSSKGLNLGFDPEDNTNIPDDCHDLLRQLAKLGESLFRRYQEMLSDEHNLFNRRLTPSDPVVYDEQGNDLGSWQGHQNRYNTERRAARERLRRFDNRDDCDDDDLQWLGSEVETNVSYARSLVDQPAPESPRAARASVLQRIQQLGGVIKDGVVFVSEAIAYTLWLIIVGLARLVGLEARRA